MGRRTRTLLPTTQYLLEPRNPVNSYESEQIRLNQMRQAKYYNRSASDLPVPKAGETVRMKPFVLGQKSWDNAEVTRRLDERSFEIQSAGTTYRRNRQHLVKAAKPSVQYDSTEPAKVNAKIWSDQTSHLQPEAPAVQTSPEGNHVQTSPGKQHAAEKTVAPSPRRTRSGRIIRGPAKLSDYVRIWIVLLNLHLLMWRLWQHISCSLCSFIIITFFFCQFDFEQYHKVAVICFFCSFIAPNF